MATDYKGLKDESASLDHIDESLLTRHITNIDYFQSDDASCISLEIDNSKWDRHMYPAKLLFKFYGEGSQKMALNALMRIKEEKELTLKEQDIRKQDME